MKKIGLIFLTVALIVLTSCKDNRNQSENQNNPAITQPEEDLELERDRDREDDKKTRTVNMVSKSNSKVTGEVRFTEEKGKVRMEAKFSGLNPGGTHAIHLHENGDCSSDDAMSAGGHWNPTNDRHGKWEDSEGYHRGDIGNLKADQDGKATLSFETDQWCIDCNDDQRNIIGKSVIVHEDADDFESQPTGDAGGRISCGEIK